MKFPRSHLMRIRGLLRKRSVVREFDQEIEFHLAMETDDLVRSGLSRAEASRLARARFGNASQIRKEFFEQLGVPQLSTMKPQETGGEGDASMIGSLLQDLRYGARSLLARPLFSGIVIVMLAMGVAGNTAIFSMLHPFLFRPLPYPMSESLVHLFQTDLTRQGEIGWDQVRQSPATYLDWKEELNSFDDLGAYYYKVANLSGEGAPPVQLTVGLLTPDVPTLLGTEPLLGRLFSEEEGQPGRDRVALLGHGLWQTRFGGDESILGRSIRLDGDVYTVVGVMPRGFNFPFGSVRLWTPLSLDADQVQRDGGHLLTVGRLSSEGTIGGALEELRGLHSSLSEEHPEPYKDTGVRVVPLRQALVFFYDQFLVLGVFLLVAVALVLVVVCANVANLMIARAAHRQREIAIRRALGAGKGRIAAQMLTESFLLALGGASLGALLAFWSVRGIGSIIPAELYRVGEVGIDGPALLYALGLALIAASLFGIVPALQSARNELTPALQESARSTQSVRSRRITRALVAAQVALAMFLCGGAALTIQAVDEFKGKELGFNPGHLITLQLSLPKNDYPGLAEIRGFQERVLERIGTTPGVLDAALATPIPLDFQEEGIEFQVRGRDSVEEAKKSATISRVSPGYFPTMEVSLLQGRTFRPSDRSDTGAVAIVSASLASKYFPEGGGIGETLVLERDGQTVETTIVGIAADSLGGIIFMGVQDRVYLPLAQSVRRSFFILSRTRGEPGALASSLREQVWAIDPGLPVGEVLTMDQKASQAYRPLEVASTLLIAFGAFAVLLAAIGIYGVVSYAASFLKREIAIRIALGADRKRVLRLVLRQSLVMSSIGMVTGGLLTVALIKAAESVDPGSPTNLPAVLLSTAMLLSVTVLVATLIPARRALKVDPIQTLRTD